jgi:hypothetical protein
LEPAKERLDFAREISTAPYGINHVIYGAGERKVAVLGVRLSRTGGNAVPGVVERSTEVLDKFTEHIAHIVKLGTKFPRWFDFMNFMVGLIRMRLDHFVVWAAVNECLDLRLKLVKVFFSSFEFTVRTGERIRHN